MPALFLSNRLLSVRFLLFILMMAFSPYFFFFHIKAGISSAYQEKPCLDPTDPECPMSAPNKNHSSQVRKRGGKHAL